jgi:HK97 family phage prohead protease
MADDSVTLLAQTEVMYSKGVFVTFDTLAGKTYGTVTDVDTEKGMLTVEVIEEYKGERTYTGIEVTHPVQAFSICDPIEVKDRDQVILAKLKEFKMDVTTSDDGMPIGVIEGYASTYGNTDLGGDIVKKGSFTQTLMHKGGKTLLLFDHGYKTTDIAGVAYYSDDDRGLRMKGELPLSNPNIKAAYDAIKFVSDRGVPMGLSIGYNTIKKNMLADGRRELLELSLEETSITPFPMNTEARIMNAKTKRLIFASKALLWNELKTDAPTEGSLQGEDDTESLLLELKTTINSMLKT